MRLTIGLALAFLLAFFAMQATAQNDQKIRWQKNRLLKWSDFKGPIDTAAKFEATTFCEVYAKYNWTKKNNQYLLTFSTASYLDPFKSSSIKQKQTPQLLRHEQLHFDIAELFARIYLQRLKLKTYTAAFKAEIEQLNQDNLRNLKTVQDLYDEQTDHSENKYMQAKWEGDIA